MKHVYRLFTLIIISLFFLSCENKTYHVGDVVLADGTVLSSSQFQTYKGNSKPMAVIFSVTGGEHENSNRVLGVGIKASEPLVFAPESAESHNTNILANYSIVVAQDYSITDGQFHNEGFFGLIDGRKTWKNVAQYDANAKTSFADYPAYDYAVNYGINNKFKKFEHGWYLPTAAEARMLAASNVPDMPVIIWTASQSYNAQVNELLVNLTNGYVETGFKEMEYSVCSIYCFAE